MKQATDRMPEGGHGELLREVDIRTVIDYFGCTELLDTIGFSTIAGYMEACGKDGLYDAPDCSVNVR